jgi:hypothetical protein
MYMQKYILLLSVVQSQPTHTLGTCNQATKLHTFDKRKNSPLFFFTITVEPRLSEIKGADPISDNQNFG